MKNAWQTVKKNSVFMRDATISCGKKTETENQNWWCNQEGIHIMKTKIQR